MNKTIVGISNSHDSSLCLKYMSDSLPNEDEICH